MTEPEHNDEQELGRLLRALPSPPESWAAAARLRPQIARWARELETQGVEAAAAQQHLAEQVERALRDSGIEATPELVDSIRRSVG